jgi:hypothetical protein
MATGISNNKQLILADNIMQGKLTREEAIFVALCVDHAIEHEVQNKIGTFGMSFLKSVTQERKKAE